MMVDGTDQDPQPLENSDLARRTHADLVILVRGYRSALQGVHGERRRLAAELDTARAENAAHLAYIQRWESEDYETAELIERVEALEVRLRTATTDALNAYADSKQAEIDALPAYAQDGRWARSIRTQITELRATARAATTEPAAALAGFSMWLDRDQWGHVIDGLIRERESALTRKAANSESTSDIRVDAIAEVITAIGEAAKIRSATTEPAHCDACHRPLPHNEQEAARCPVTEPAKPTEKPDVNGRMRLQPANRAEHAPGCALLDDDGDWHYCTCWAATSEPPTDKDG